jgi:cobalamin biosynthesis protein cbiG
VDEWAKHQNCTVLEPERIKLVSGALLAGKTVQFASDWPIAGAPPDGITAGDAPDFALTLCPAGDALHLVPRIGVLGVGCKRGTSAETLAEAFAAFCAQNRLAPQCITAAASIDLKQNEAGLLTFCKSHSWPVQFFTAEQLRAAPGSFTPSAFVQSVTGVDNVCERSAVLAAGGTLVFHKYAHTGVTFALAVRPYAPDWRWQNV